MPTIITIQLGFTAITKIKRCSFLTHNVLTAAVKKNNSLFDCNSFVSAVS